MKVLVLGPKGTNGHEAAIRYGFQLADIAFLKSHQAILEEIDNTSDDLSGVVAIENSLASLVSETVQFWLKGQIGRIVVVGEITMPVNHCLLVRGECKDLKTISFASSHSQALAQCSGFITDNGLVGVPSASTAEAARRVAIGELRDTAAIASVFAAKQYGLEIIAQNIEDYSENATRFHIVGSVPVEFIKGENYCTAVMFRLQNVPGVIVSAVSPISEEYINMHSLHSISLGKMGEYAFYCEFSCHQDSPEGTRILRQMRLVCVELKILGSFRSQR